MVSYLGPEVRFLFYSFLLELSVSLAASVTRQLLSVLHVFFLCREKEGERVNEEASRHETAVTEGSAENREDKNVRGWRQAAFPGLFSFA